MGSTRCSFPRLARLTAAVVVAAALGCHGSHPAKTDVASIAITPGALLLSGVGEARVLSAEALDAKGQPVHASLTWSSSAPAQISVDATGKVTARAIGSAQIFAHSSDVRSPPVLVMAAEPKQGALLVADAQVVSVGEPKNLAAGEAPGIGALYEVRLRGLAAPPAAGTIVLAAETA